MLNGFSTNIVSFLAIKTDDYIEIFKEYDEYFSNFSVVTDILRVLGWLTLKGLLKIANLLNILLSKVFDFINFLDSSQAVKFFNTLKPFIWTVFFLALIYLAYCYIYAHEKPKGVFTNVLLFVGTVMILPYMMSQMNKIVTYGKDFLLSDMEDNGYELLVPYITDLVYLDSMDFDSEKFNNGERNGFTDKNSGNIRYLNINEVVDPGDYKLNNKKLFKQQLSSEIKKGKDKLVVTNIKKSKYFFMDTTPYYYRYHVNFFIAVLYLLALILVMIFSSFKLILLIYELAAEKIMAPFIAAGDLTGGQKIRKALIGILNGYITILCVLLLQRIFILGTEYINLKTWSDNDAANGFIKTVLILAGAFFVIDGPNFFEQIFGVDAGLKSVGQALQSAYYGGKMAGGAIRAAKGAAGKLIGAPKSAADKVGGMAKKAAGEAARIMGAINGAKDTGAFETNNEKVSQALAQNTAHPDNGKPSATGNTGGSDAGMTGEALSGAGNGVANSSQNAEAETSMGNISGSSANSPGQTNAPELSGGDGRQNLSNSSSGSEDNRNVNNAINDALNNTASGTGGSGGSTGSQPRDNANLANWAMNNTKAGRFLKGNYEKGKSFGHAAGNTVNQINRKKENKAPEQPQNMNKDNLKN